MTNKDTAQVDLQTYFHTLLQTVTTTVVPLDYEDIGGEDISYPYLGWELNFDINTNTVKYAPIYNGELIIVIQDKDFQNTKTLSDLAVKLIGVYNTEYEIENIKISSGDTGAKTGRVYYARIQMKVKLDGVR